jgi:hypothetical protein
MRTAPAVTVAVAPDPVWRGGLLFLGVLVGGLLPAWAVAHLIGQGRPDTFQWLWAAALAGVVPIITARAAWRLRQPPCARLSWNGQVWQLLDAQSQATPVRLSVRIDTGGWLLLHARTVGHAGEPFEPAVRSVWIALSERSLPQSWHALRCAVHGPPPAADAAADPGARA